MEQEIVGRATLERWHIRQSMNELVVVISFVHVRVAEMKRALGAVAADRDRLVAEPGGDEQMRKARRAEKQQAMEELSVKIEALQRVAVVVGEILKQEQRDYEQVSGDINKIQGEAGTVGWAEPPRVHGQGQGGKIIRYDLRAPAGAGWLEAEDRILRRLTIKLIKLERPEKGKLMAQIVGGDAIHRDFQCTAVEKIRGEIQWWEQRADTVAELAEAVTTHIQEVEAIGWPQ